MPRKTTIPLTSAFTSSGPVRRDLAESKFISIPRPAVASRQHDDKGLPDSKGRRDLAFTYLQTQHRLWPELAKAGVLPALTDESVQRLADDFERRFLAGAVEQFESTPRSALGNELGVGYVRFSADNSNPRSLDQQLLGILERAHRDKVFIPWQYVLADAAVTGTTAHRRGYQLAKALIESPAASTARLYIDEIGRASRYAIESLKLGNLIERHGKRLIGVSDGFDSTSPHAKLMLHMYAMMHEWFVDQLRSKVYRGMNDAFAQGKNINAPSFGYRLVPATDGQGNTVFDADGSPVKAKVIDETEQPHVVLAFTLYALKGRSRDKIAQHFNEIKAGGRNTWDGSQIRQLLERELYIGVEYYRMTQQVRDPETGAVSVKRRPRNEWLRREMPHLRIVSDKLFKSAEARSKKTSDAYQRRRNEGPKPERSVVYPTTLFRPICGYCGSRLILGRSGRFSSFCCSNGRNRKHDCKLHSYKSVRVVEMTLLSHLQEQVFTEDFIRTVVNEANQFLMAESKRPREDIRPIVSEIQKIERKLNQLVKAVAGDGDRDLEPLVDQVRTFERRRKELQERLDQIRRREAPLPPPIGLSDVVSMLADLRSLLSREIEIAAPLLDELLGPITVTEDQREARQGKAWMASFTINAAPVLARLAMDRDCPTKEFWELLTLRGWTVGRHIDVRIEAMPKPERIAAEAKCLEAKGASLETIGRALRCSRDTVAKAVGRSHKKKVKRKVTQRSRNKRSPPRTKVYPDLADDVTRMRDEQRQTFAAIARCLKVSHGTSIRAYDLQHPECVQQAAIDGRKPRRGRYTLLGHEKIAHIRQMLAIGEKANAIAAHIGCSVNSVFRIRAAMRQESPEIMKEADKHIRANRSYTKPLSQHQILRWRKLQERVQSLRMQGHSHRTIAANLGVDCSTVLKALRSTSDHAIRHEEPERRRHWLPQFRKLVATVEKMHDHDKLAFEEIARRLEVSSATVRKAYDLARPDVIHASIANGEPPQRGCRSRLGADRIERIRKMIQAGTDTRDIMAAAACSRTTVNRMRRMIDAQRRRKSRRAR